MSGKVAGPRLRSTEAQLFVADIERSCAFYSSKLGFRFAFVFGGPPHYGQVERDDARFNLRVVGEPVFAGDIRERLQLLSASLTVATSREIERLYATFRAADVPMRQSLRTESWEAKTFVVSDPDGNLVLFAGPSA